MAKLETLELKFEDSNAWIVFSSTSYDTKTIRNTWTALDLILANPAAKCVIFTTEDPKLFSAGLDFEELITGIHDANNFLSEFAVLNSRIMSFPLPTICGINGHCIAGGVMFAMSTDYRIALKGKFIFEMREIGMGMGMPRFMLATLLAKVGPRAARDLALFGNNLSQQKALELEVIDEVVEGKEEFLKRLSEKATELSVIGEQKDAIKAIKVAIYRDFIKSAETTFEKYSYVTVRSLMPKL